MANRLQSRRRVRTPSSQDPSGEYDDEEFMSESEPEEADEVVRDRKAEDQHEALLAFCGAIGQMENQTEFDPASVPACDR
jgi:hypothetical protein